MTCDVIFNPCDDCQNCTEEALRRQAIEDKYWERGMSACVWQAPDDPTDDPVLRV